MCLNVKNGYFNLFVRQMFRYVSLENRIKIIYSVLILSCLFYFSMNHNCKICIL